MTLEFKSITLESRHIIESYTKDWGLECSDLSFTNLFIWGTGGKMEYAEAMDCLYIKLDYEGVPVYLWSPVPKFKTEVNYREAVYLAINYLKDRGIEPTLRSVCVPFKEKIESCCPELFIQPLEMTWDYVYDRESMATLKGKKLHGKRNHINKFNSEYPIYEYKTMDSSMIEECMALYDEWTTLKEESSIELFEERKSVQLALDNMEELGLTGGAIFIEGKIAAFTLGERLQPHMQLIHIEKARYGIEGIFPVINQQYVINACQDVTLINREEDMGLPGMRKAKRSYQPVKMIEKYFISTRQIEDPASIWKE